MQITDTTTGGSLKGLPPILSGRQGERGDMPCNLRNRLRRWFILEGEREDGDTIIVRLAIGLLEDEYGYVSLKELSEIELNLTSYGFGILQVTQVPDFKPTALKDIKDYRLQELLARLEN